MLARAYTQEGTESMHVVEPPRAERHESPVHRGLALPAKVLRRLGRQVFESGTVNVYQWALEHSLGLPAPGQFTARELLPAELADVARSFGKSPGEYHRRAHLGDRCFASLDGSRVVHVRWVARRPVELVEVGLLICPAFGEAYVYDSFTAPEYRGQRTSSSARALMDRTLLAEGVRRGYAYVLASNHTSLRSLGGYHQKLCELRYMRVFRGPPQVRGEIPHPLYRPDAVPAPGG